MAKLIECASCGGLKQVDSVRCPHCQVASSGASSLLKRTLTAAGLVAACGPGQNQYPTDAYGAPCFADQDSGICVPYSNGQDSGPGDGGKLTDSGVPMDAYGVPPFRDAGPQDGGNGSGGGDD